MATTNQTQGAPRVTSNDDGQCHLQYQVITYMSIYIIIIVLIIVGNIFILKTLLSIKANFRRNIDIFILYLSCFDLLATLMIMVDVYEQLSCYRYWPFGLIGCKLVYPLYHISLSMTVCILAIMSIDRCRSIINPFNTKFKRRTIHILVFASFLISASFQWYQFVYLKIGESGMCTVNRQYPMYAFPRLIEVFFRDGVFLGIFTMTTVLIYKSLSNRDFKSNKSYKVISMLIIMELAFILLVMPYDIYDSAMLLSRVVPGFEPIKPTRVVLHVDRFLSILQMSNSFANCFIYAKIHNQIRNTRSTKRLRSRHNNLTVSNPQTHASYLLNSRKSITSILTSSLSSNEYIGEQVLPLVTQINQNGALTATVVTKV
ncbi:neuropeptides B/W receptor type 2-like [Clytia hemisphaerica]|uniref:neuropeptides B/W receptor type 2-like n=1 Tax=Clytia hemisphaerica TaxID=252671 RepID=UPI0034D63290